MAYPGSVDLISGIRPKNNGTFPLVNAQDVYIDDNTRLPEALRRAAASSGAAAPGWPLYEPPASGDVQYFLRSTAFPVTYVESGSDVEWHISAAHGADLTYDQSAGLVRLSDADRGVEVATFAAATGAMLALSEGISEASFHDGRTSIVGLVPYALRTYAVNVVTPENGGMRVSFDIGSEIGSGVPVTTYATGVDIARGEMLVKDGLLFHCRDAISAADNVSWNAVKSQMDYMSRELALVVDCSDLSAPPVLDWPGQVDMYDGAGAPSAPRAGRVSIYRCREYMLRRWSVELVTNAADSSPQAVSPDGSLNEAKAHASLADIATMVADAEAGWLADPMFVGAPGQIMVWTDAGTMEVDGQIVSVPKVKIGDGRTYCVDLPFAGDDIAARISAIASSLSNHERDMVRHITATERAYWNDKVTTGPAIVNETLVITKDNLIS